MHKKSIPAGDKHKAFHDAIMVVLNEYGRSLSAQEMLALTAQIVGKTIALQDQRITSPSLAMSIVADNIQIGNKLVIDELMNKTAGEA